MIALGISGWAAVFALILALLGTALWPARADDVEPLRCGCGHGVGGHSETGCGRCGCAVWKVTAP